jgi:GNAT superfamily N-acetyltransferase
MGGQGQAPAEITIRRCDPADHAEIHAIINAAAEAYRGVIPADRWHEPYMPADALASELADGVTFSGCVAQGRLIGVMGVQHRLNVDLIRHAYVLPEWQGHGIGARLLEHLCRDAERPILIGTWKAANWAIRFYERHGFVRVHDRDVAPLLDTYWHVPARQIATSVVLTSPPLSSEAVRGLIAELEPSGGSASSPDPR